MEGVWALPLLPSRPRILSRLKPFRRVSPLPSSSCDTEIHAGPEALKWNQLPCTPGHLHTWTRGQVCDQEAHGLSGARPASPHRDEPHSARRYLTDVLPASLDRVVHQKGSEGQVPVLKLPACCCVTLSKSLKVWVFSSINRGWSTDFTPSSGGWGHRRCMSASGGGKVHSGLNSSSDIPESSRSPATNPPDTHISPATFRSSLEAEVQGGVSATRIRSPCPTPKGGAGLIETLARPCK